MQRCNAGAADLLVPALPVIACQGKLVASLQQVTTDRGATRISPQVCRTPGRAGLAPPPHPVLPPSPQGQGSMSPPVTPPSPTPQSCSPPCLRTLLVSSGILSPESGWDLCVWVQGGGRGRPTGAATAISSISLQRFRLSRNAAIRPVPQPWHLRGCD